MTFKEWKVDDGAGGGRGVGGGLAMACLYAVPPYNQTTRESERPLCILVYILFDANPRPAEGIKNNFTDALVLTD